MAENVKLLSARRAYEFGPDDIRLTILTTQTVQARLRERFAFTVAAVGTPIPTFGPVTGALPPGLVFNTGSYTTDSGHIIPIRFLHFEATRIVIDVAGTSEDVGHVYSELRRAIDELGPEDASKVLGEPTHIHDQSEITWRPAFDLASILRPELLAAFREFGHPEADFSVGCGSPQGNAGSRMLGWCGVEPRDVERAAGVL